METQAALVLSWLAAAHEARERGETPEPITNAFMFVRGVGRGQSRISDLRKAGHDIRTDTITVTKANGSTAHVASYVFTPRATPGQSVLWDTAPLSHESTP